jgi:hypothetical protein
VGEGSKCEASEDEVPTRQLSRRFGYGMIFTAAFHACRLHKTSHAHSQSSPHSYRHGRPNPHNIIRTKSKPIMSSAGTTANKVVWKHRHILWLILDASKVLNMFPELTADEVAQNAAWLNMSINQRDAACYRRQKLICAMMGKAKSIPKKEHTDSYRLDWMCVPGTPGKRNPYRKLDGVTVHVALAVCEQMVRKLVATQAFRSDEDPSAEKQYFGHGFDTMCIQSVPVGFLAPETGKPNEYRPIVYALRDANDQIQYVKSNKKKVAVENIMFYPHAKQLDYEEEIRHRRLVVVVSTQQTPLRTH